MSLLLRFVALVAALAFGLTSHRLAHVALDALALHGLAVLSSPSSARAESRSLDQRSARLVSDADVRPTHPSSDETAVSNEVCVDSDPDEEQRLDAAPSLARVGSASRCSMRRRFVVPERLGGAGLLRELGAGGLDWLAVRAPRGPPAVARV